MDGSRSPEPGTRLVTAGRREEWTQGIVNPPVWRASTILYDSVADLKERNRDTHHRLYYGRRGTPTQWSLAEALTELEPGAEATLLYPSGVAAVSTALLSVLGPGDELVVEWRALTVALMDEVAAQVRTMLHLDAQRLPLACVLEGGSWAAGRELAQQRRGGLPPLRVASDGTVF